MVNYNSAKYILDEGEEKPTLYKMSWFSKTEHKWDKEIQLALQKFSPKKRISYIDENFDKHWKWIDNDEYKWKPCSKW